MATATATGQASDIALDLDLDASSNSHLSSSTATTTTTTAEPANTILEPTTEPTMPTINTTEGTITTANPPKGTGKKSPTLPSNPNTSILESKLASAASLTVYDARGNAIRFGALWELEKTVVVFIRHFFCGNCQQYITQLTTVRPEALERAGTKVVIVGCGDWLLIDNYRELTCPTPHPLISYYADPTRTLYRALGLTTETLAPTPKGERKRGYLTMGKLENTARSVMRAMRNPMHWGRQGNISQLGGEFIIGPSNACSFGHYMRHTEDHAEVADVFREAGVVFP
ncbi:hypothetical protein K439DRAFT_1639490 [Ramaria rubella]|nr:hypothetical protein K439DRAFT_1639490 [Ramaria rubella]